MVGGRSTVVSSHRSPLLFPFVTLCLMHAARGGPVTQLKVDWLFPWNISCSTCGPLDLNLTAYCRQTQPMYPLRVHCKWSITPNVDVFAVQYTGVITLDGTYLASRARGREILLEACPDIGVGPCPWFANETYSGEKDWYVGGTSWILNLPKGHYETKVLATNQDGAMIACISCQCDVKHY